MFAGEILLKISDPFENDSLLYLDTIQICEVQHVYVREFGCVGEFASVIMGFREHHICKNGGELSWEFLDELSSMVAPCNIEILTFLKSHSLFIQ